jgi:2-haloacid dehalogenase
MVESVVKALAFDTGGTVLNWYAGVKAVLQDVGHVRGVSADWDAFVREYRRRSLETMLGAVGPRFNIDDVHRSVLDQLLREHQLDSFTGEDKQKVAESWHSLQAWPDFPPALVRLRNNFVVASFTILTTSIVIDNSRSNDMVWDCVIPCEMLGIYKTQPESYRLAAKFLRLNPHEIMMVACHNFDLLAARKEGFASAFVRRPEEWGPSGPPDPVADPSHDLVVDSFDELATRLGA